MAIDVKDVVKEYPRGKSVFKAVDMVNLTLAQGDFISIVGRSGSGKSTLLNIIAGLVKPASGEVLADGRNIFALSDKELSLYRNTKIGYVLQGQSALAGLTVLDNARVPFHLSNRKEDSTGRARELLRQVGIEHLADSYPKHLSGGELKRAAIARALINKPEFLIADEPTGDLDAQTTAEIMELLKTIAEGGTGVLIVTHEPDTTAYGNRVFVMDSGVLAERWEV